MSDYPPTCRGCNQAMQPMAHGEALPTGRRKVVMVCETCDGPTLETMWGAGADEDAIAAWVAAAWNEGHRAGCVYFPDCVELGHHEPNPYASEAPQPDQPA